MSNVIEILNFHSELRLDRLTQSISTMNVSDLQERLDIQSGDILDALKDVNAMGVNEGRAEASDEIICLQKEIDVLKQRLESQGAKPSVLNERSISQCISTKYFRDTFNEVYPQKRYKDYFPTVVHVQVVRNWLCELRGGHEAYFVLNKGITHNGYLAGLSMLGKSKSMSKLCMSHDLVKSFIRETVRRNEESKLGV